MNRRTFLGGALTAAAGFSAARKPNIVLLLADDLGYGGTGPYGETEFPTPNIDSIARGGVRFTNGYVSCPVCSPTRAGMLTGRYQQRFGHESNWGNADTQPALGLSLEEKTIADRLKPLGYRTGIVGKWHLGFEPQFHPARRGFDEFFGFPAGSHSYLDPNEDPRNPILRGTERVDEKEYLTDAFAREAVDFIDRHRADPFFLYLAFNAPHLPMEAPAKYMDRFSKIADLNRRTHAAMMTGLDEAIGRVLGTLNRHKLMRDTLIFFLSDNGGPDATTSRNDPLHGRKGQTYEGGIRVPFLMRWDGTLPKGKTIATPVISLDVLPTVVSAAGGSVSAAWKLDGVNLLPFAKGEDRGVAHESLYWRFGPHRAIRKGDWKLVWPGSDKPELYNLAADLSETRDLAAVEPARAAELKADWEAWSSQMQPPRWRNPRDPVEGRGLRKTSRPKK